MSNSRNVLVGYHFFPHYRRAVFSRLLNNDDSYFFVLAGDVDGRAIDPSIAAWRPPEKNFLPLRIFRIIGQFYWQPTLIRLALTGRFDCVILLGDMNNISSWLAALLFRLRGIRLLFWAHGWIDSGESQPKAFIRKSFFSLSNGLLLYGRRSKRLAIERGFDPSKIWVIYNSLDYETQRAIRNSISDTDRSVLRKSLFGTDEIPIVACITRLTAIRRLDLLISCLSSLKIGGHECVLLLIGDGPERVALEKQAKDLDVRLHCTGALYEEAEIAPLLTAATVTVAPGKVGLTAMHSLAYGIPVITHGDFDNQMPECEAVVPGLTGDFFQLGNIDDLAVTIRRWTLCANVPTSVQDHCINVIERFYNAENQAAIIKSASLNKPPAVTEGESLQPSEILS